MATDPIIVIPAYNEAGSLPALIGEIAALLPQAVTVVVDDGSTDATSDLLPILGVRWLRLPARVGTGTAVRTGLRFALELGFTTAVRLDGDGQHPPAEIRRLMAPILLGDVDAVQGNRYGDAIGYRTPVPRRAAQRVLATALSVATGRTVSDPTSGFWAFGPRAMKLLARHHPHGYPEPELLLLLHAHGLRVTEVGVRMRPRTVGRTSLTGIRLGVALTRVLFGTVLARLRAAPGGARP
jgi:glycosyltransferase involved in cell wall biosynthesis